MAKLYLFAVLSLFLTGGCASSEEKQQTNTSADARDSYPNLAELKKPGQKPHKAGKVYVDSVKQVTTANSKKALLISGRLADGCTYLESVTHRAGMEDQSLILRLSAWRDSAAACTQALVPFSYIYRKLDKEAIGKYSQATVNGKTYTF